MCKCLKTWRSDRPSRSWYTVKNRNRWRVILMAKTNQETVTAFWEVVCSSNTAHTYCAANNTKNRTTSNDNRLMIYYQGMKLYITDEFQSDALLQLLRTLKKLWWNALQKAQAAFFLPAAVQISENRSQD